MIPQLREAVLRDRHGGEMARAPARNDRDVILMVHREEVATHLQLIYATGETSINLPPRLLAKGDVQNFGRMRLERMQG